MEHVKIVIEIKGGAVYCVCSNAPIEYITIDRDAAAVGEIFLQHMVPDLIAPQLHTLYTGDTQAARMIRDYLQKADF